MDLVSLVVHESFRQQGSACDGEWLFRAYREYYPPILDHVAYLTRVLKAQDDVLPVGDVAALDAPPGISLVCDCELADDPVDAA